jgi:hypothetical protein
MSAETSALVSTNVPDPSPATALVVTTHLLDTGPPPFWTNLPTQEELGQALVMRCQGQASDKVEDWWNKPFPTKWLFACPASKTDEKTGEITEWTQVTLLSPEGRSLSFGSNGVLKSLRWILALKGRGPWNPAIGLIPKQIAIAGGHRYYQLELACCVVIDSPKEVPNGKSKRQS